MLVGKQDIKAYFKKVSKKYFSIYYRGKVEAGSPIYKSKDEEGVSVEDAYNDFEDALSLLRTGEYTLMMNDDPKVSNRGGNRTDFRVTLEESMANGVRDIPAPAAAGIGGTYTLEDVMQKAKGMAMEEFAKLKAIDDLEKSKAENAALLKRVTDAEKQVSDPWNKFIGALAPHADKIISGFVGPTGVVPPVVGMTPIVASRVSGVDHDEHVIDNDPDHVQKVFEDFTSSLQLVRPDDWVNILVKLTDIINNNPSKFNSALNFL